MKLGHLFTHFAVYNEPLCMVHTRFWPKLSGKKIIAFKFFNAFIHLFLFIYLFIYLFNLDTWFLYWNFSINFEHTMVQEILCNK